MKCIKCGYDNLDGLKYCTSCGNELLTKEQMKKKEGKKRSKLALRIVIIVLILALVTCVISYIIINNKNKPKETEEVNKTIDPVLVGTWYCKAYKDAPNYTIQIEFKEDRSYVWGTYGKINLDYTKGTFYSKDMGTFPENENYELYSVTLEATRRASNGAEVDDVYNMNYSLALHSDKNNMILANGNSNSYNTYCTRKM